MSVGFFLFVCLSNLQPNWRLRLAQSICMHASIAYKCANRLKVTMAHRHIVSADEDGKVKTSKLHEILIHTDIDD